jgi:hypothetical protein
VYRCSELQALDAVVLQQARELFVSRQISLFRQSDDIVHACEGTHLEDGTPLVWSVCTGEPVIGVWLDDEDCVTCKRCRTVRAAAHILQNRVLAVGPPDLLSSSLPRSLQ